MNSRFERLPAELGKYGINVWQRVDDQADWPAILDRFAAIERTYPDLGAIWTGEGPLGKGATAASLPFLGFVAAKTERLRLGTSILLAPMYSPAALGHALTSLDHLSRGRMVAGLGAGMESFRLAAGYEANWGRSYDALVRTTIALIRGETVTSHEQRWRLDDAVISVLPRQDRLPVLLGGGTDVAVRRAAELADGWLASVGANAAEVRAGMAVVRSTCDRLGRDPATLTVVKRVFLRLDGTGGGGAETAGAAVIEGSLEHCRNEIGELFDAGVDHIILHPTNSQVDHVDAILEGLVGSV